MLKEGILIKDTFAIRQKTSYGDHDPDFSWEEFLEFYSACGLTYDTDRLPAISGIAERFQRVIKDTYHAGLWGRSLPLSLLWYYRQRSTPSKGQLKPYIAPSWSCASAQGHVFFDEASDISGSTRVHVELLSVELSLKSKHRPFGEVKGGCILLRGKLLLVKRNAPDNGLKASFLISPPGEQQSSANPPKSPHTVLPCVTKPLPALVKTTIRLDWCDKNDKTNKSSTGAARTSDQQAGFLPVATHTGKLQALLLNELQSEQYRRVGHLSLRCPFHVDGKRGMDGLRRILDVTSEQDVMIF